MKIDEFEPSIENTDFTFWKFVKYAVIAMIFFAILGLLGNIFGIFSSVATAPGRVIQKTMQTENIIQSYEWFYDVNAAYTARHNQVVQYKSFMLSETDKTEIYRLRTELAAMQQTCRDLATKYNANSEKMNKSIFKGWALPDTLSHQICN